MQKTFELDLSALPQHEQKLANRELHDLHKKIEKQKPKKSFALKKKTKLPPKVEGRVSFFLLPHKHSFHVFFDFIFTLFETQFTWSKCGKIVWISSIRYWQYPCMIFFLMSQKIWTLLKWRTLTKSYPTKTKSSLSQFIQTWWVKQKSTRLSRVMLVY